VTRAAVAAACVVVFGAILVAAFGWGALWFYLFAVAILSLFALGLRHGGDVIQAVSRRRFDDRR
jgi:fatty acid desaturase